MAMEVFGLCVTVVDIANKIKNACDDVKGFPDRCHRLCYRIDSLLPAVRLLDESAVAIIQDKGIPIKTYETALRELLQCVNGIYQFTDKMKDQSFLKRFMDRNNIESQFDDFSERLDILRGNLQFCLLVELRVLFDKSAEDMNNMKREFEKSSKEAFKNRQEIDSEDQRNDEKHLIVYLQDLSKGQQEQTELMKKGFADLSKGQQDHAQKLEELLADLQISSSKPAFNPVGFKVEEIKTIKQSELGRMEKIGEGSLGVVYKAMYGKEVVAVKKLHPDRKANLTELGLNLKEEAKNLKRFDSKHVVRLWGIVNEPGSDTMIVFDYMDRGTLRSFLKDYKDRPSDLSWEIKIRMSRGGALGLYRIHNLQPKMLHCDVGSEKFLVNSNFEVKICDVGFSKTKTSAGKTKNRKKMRELGTRYFAPEHLQTNTQKYDERSEIYSYGLVMWEIATCQLAFDGMTASEQTTFLEDKKKLPLPDNCPQDFAQTIDRCRSDERELRPLAGDLVDDLQNCKRCF